jgi:hypothetical protein
VFLLNFKSRLHVRFFKTYGCFNRKSQKSPDTEHIRYRLLGTWELVELNYRLRNDFRSTLGNGPEDKKTPELNYVAFCDVTDGHFLAILLHGRSKGRVFFLDRESAYDKESSDLYYTLADSLEAWIRLIVATGGWGGRGESFGGF